MIALLRAEVDVNAEKARQALAVLPQRLMMCDDAEELFKWPQSWCCYGTWRLNAGAWCRILWAQGDARPQLTWSWSRWLYGCGHPGRRTITGAGTGQHTPGSQLGKFIVTTDAGTMMFVANSGADRESWLGALNGVDMAARLCSLSDNALRLIAEVEGARTLMDILAPPAAASGTLEELTTLEATQVKTVRTAARETAERREADTKNRQTEMNHEAGGCAGGACGGGCGGCVAAPTPAVFDSHSDTKGIGFLRSTEAAEAVSAEQASELLRTLGGNVGAGHRSCPKAELLDETTRHALIRHIDERSRNDKNKNCGHDLRLEPTRADLEALIGAPTVASLITFFGAKPDAFRLRRVEADANKTDAAVAFHTDFSRRTMQVPLNDEGDYDGGRLVFVTDQGLEMPSRPAGSATIHTSGVVHGVTALRRGVRYSLYLCQLPDGGVDINKRHLDGCGLSYLADPVALQFDFFARAVPFLETATDAELGRVVAAYAAFLRVAVSTTDALKAPSLGVEIVWRVRFHSTFRFLFTHSRSTLFSLSAHVLLDVCGRRTC